MNSGSKILLVLALLAVAATGAYFFLFADSDSPGPNAPPRPGTTAEDQGDPEVVTRIATEPSTRAATRPDDRQPLRAEVRGDDGTSFDQGITGQLVDENGAPVPDAEVYLFEGVGANIFAAMIERQEGVVKPPLAQTVSDGNGLFRLGVREVEQGKTFELRAIGTLHADASRPNLTLFPGKWWDAGRVTMPRGILVTGRVTDQRNGAPIADAQVFLNGQSQQMLLGNTPGREQGITVRTDAAGQYRIENASAGVHTIGAVGVDYAQVEKPNVNIQGNQENAFDFELPPGMAIAGVVTDSAGIPVGGARIAAHAISAKTPLSRETRSLGDGTFELIGLVEGPYQLNVTAQGYVAAKEPAVQAGTLDTQIVMETQGRVRVRVVAANGREINQFNLTLKNWIPTQESVGNIPSFKTILVRPRDLDPQGYYELSGLNPSAPNQYKLEIDHGRYAKNYSEPFDVVAGSNEPVTLTVTLSDGGRIAGQVVDENGQPLGGVTVSTLPNTYQDNALAEMFRVLIPFEVSRAHAKTGADGRFELERLYPAMYQLQFDHPEHFKLYEKDYEVLDGQVTDGGVIRMQRGTLLFGTVRVDGIPTAQVKVNVATKADPDNPPATPFSATAITNDQGEWVVPNRLPPGVYTAQAGRQAGPQHFFTTVLDFKQTQTDFTIHAGQAQLELPFQITSSPTTPQNTNPLPPNPDLNRDR